MTLSKLGSVTVNGVNYESLRGGLNVLVKDGEVSHGYILMGSTLTTADGKTYTKSSGSANVLVESSRLQALKTLSAKLKATSQTQSTSTVKRCKLKMTPTLLLRQ